MEAAIVKLLALAALVALAAGCAVTTYDGLAADERRSYRSCIDDCSSEAAGARTAAADDEEARQMAGWELAACRSDCRTEYRPGRVRGGDGESKVDTGASHPTGAVVDHPATPPSPD